MGYGDIVPTSGFGKVIGAVVMVVSIAILSIITASITSIFVDRTRRERESQHRTDQRHGNFAGDDNARHWHRCGKWHCDIYQSQNRQRGIKTTYGERE